LSVAFDQTLRAFEPQAQLSPKAYRNSNLLSARTAWHAEATAAAARRADIAAMRMMLLSKQAWAGAARKRGAGPQ
jgi:hypothetical protein